MGRFILLLLKLAVKMSGLVSSICTIRCISSAATSKSALDRADASSIHIARVSDSIEPRIDAMRPGASAISCSATIHNFLSAVHKRVSGLFVSNMR